MTTDRSRAYGRVMNMLADFGPASLHELERHRIRSALDTLVLADRHGSSTFDALADVHRLLDRLTACGRWSDERAERLMDDVAACAPAFEIPRAA